MLRTSWIKRVTTFGVLQDSENEYEKPYDIEKKETNKELYELIQRLPQKYKEILLLFYYKDLTYEEISEILQIPEGTVRSRLSRAREKLKKMMNERGVS